MRETSAPIQGVRVRAMAERNEAEQGVEAPEQRRSLPKHRGSGWSARDNQSGNELREFQRQEEAERQRIEAEQIMNSPEFKEQQRIASEQIVADDMEKESLLNGGPDPAFVFPHEWHARQLARLNTTDKLLQHNMSVYEQLFRRGHMFFCDANKDALSNYLDSNHVKAVDLGMLISIIARLRALGMIVEKPAEHTEPVEAIVEVAVLTPEEQKWVDRQKDMTPAERRHDDKMFRPVIEDCRNPGTWLTEHQLDLLSADEFRKAHGWKTGSSEVTSKMVVPL